MISLLIIGEPIRVAFSKCLHMFKELDFLQILVLNVYLGGLVLHLIAMLPIHIFNANVIWAVIVSAGILSIMVHKEKIKKATALPRSDHGFSINLCEHLHFQKTAMLQYSVVLGMFLATLWIQVVPLSNLVFGSIHDTSLHSLFVQVLLENQGVPVTMEPYLSEGIVYPQAAHVFFAYACLILGYMPPEAILHVSTLFQALSILGVYYLGKAFLSRRLGVSLAFVFFCVSRWPRLIAWGANPYVVAFPLNFILLGLVPFLHDLCGENSIRKRLWSVLAIGILFGYLAAIHLTIYIITMASVAVLVLFELLRRDRKLGFCGLQNLSMVFGASLVPISTFIYRFVKWFPYPGHNIGLPSDVVIEPWAYVNVLNWLLFWEGISPYPLLVVMILVLIVISSITLYKRRRQLARLVDFVTISLCLLCACLGLILLFHVQYIFPSLSIVTGEVLRPTIGVYISVCFLIGASNVVLYDILKDKLSSRLTYTHIKSKQVLASNTATALAFLLLFSVYSPFMYYFATQDIEYLSKSYSSYAVTTPDDYELMLWMKENLPKNSIILVSVYEPGMFIPSVSNLKTIYPWVLSKDSHHYLKLFRMIQNGILNSTVYNLMSSLGVTYVYLGAQASFGVGTWQLNAGWEENLKWNPEVFLSNPNFNLTKKMGDAYLFEVLYKKPEVIFEDRSEYADIPDISWKWVAGKAYPREGSGHISTDSTYAHNRSRSLFLTSKNEGVLLYTNPVHRTIHAWDASNIKLNFHMNAAVGLSPPDELSIHVNAASRNRFVRIITPNRLHADKVSTMVLDGSVPYFSFNIGETCRAIYNVPLPKTFNISIQNIGFDSVENVAYKDDIVVRVGD